MRIKILTFSSVYSKVLFQIIFMILIGTTAMVSQSLSGIYGNGSVYLILEQQAENVIGTFIDVDETEYPVTLAFDEEGLLGYLGEYNAYIPYDSEKLTLYVTPFGPDNQPIWENTNEYILDYISPLEGIAEEEAVSFSWIPIQRFGTDFYPSYVMATSTMTNEINYISDDAQYSYLGDVNGYFGISLTGLPAGTNVGVVIEGEPYIKPSGYDVILGQDNTTEIYPVIEYDYIALRNINQAQPINVKYTLYIDGEFYDSKIAVVWLRSINDAVTWGKDHHGSEFSFTYIFAAYVNENEPNLDPVLGQVLEEGIVDSWIGYQGTPDDVLQQVFALWYHFQKRGFRYSSITTQSGSDDRSFGQTVRFVQDALNTKQANCIDGTVLFASFLYKIGLDVSIVLVPGHAYLAFSPDKEGEYKYALETTMMGSLDLKHTAQQNTLYAAMNNKNNEIQRSWDSFLGALDVGTQNYFNDALPGIQQQQRFYEEINIKEARKQKIRPIK